VWKHEEILDISQDGAGNQRDNDGVKCFEVYQEENLSGPAELSLETLAEEEGIDVALVTLEKKLSYLNTQSYEAYKSRQGINSKNSRLVVKRGHFRYIVFIILPCV
jgi:hypothetical protein